jgi:hypothetical protein
MSVTDVLLVRAIDYPDQSADTKNNRHNYGSCCHRFLIPVMHFDRPFIPTLTYTATHASTTMVRPSANVNTVARSDWDHAFQS